MEPEELSTSFDTEIKGRFDASNQVFKQGIDIGVKSFERLITISTVALGLLFTYRAQFFVENLKEPTHIQNGIWFFSILAFFFTIISSIKRNYFAGNELVNLGHYMRSRALKRVHPKNIDYPKNESKHNYEWRTAIKYRKRWSAFARLSFYWAISLFVAFLVIEDLLDFTKSVLQQISQGDAAKYALGIAFVLNFLSSILFAIDNLESSASEKK